MARIPDSEIDRIKTETDLIALIQSRGVALKQQGANWTGFCPFHDDKETPNLIVTPGKGLWRCMSSGCGATGNPIQFVEKFDGLSFRHAFEVLANGGKAAFEHAPEGPRAKATVPRLSCPIESTPEDAKLLEQVAAYYAERLTAPENQAARDYLASRGLDDPELWQRFGIGFADRTLGLRLPQKNRKQGAEIRARLETLGVYRKTGREHLNGCLVVPVRDVAGDIQQLYGRRIDKTVPKENRHLYLARPLAGVFNAAALGLGLARPNGCPPREIILTESLLDALTFYRHGMEAVTCTYGTANFSDELFEAIRTAKIESVKLAFDADEAGEKATSKAADRLRKIGIECHQIKLPWGSDANAYALDQGGEALRRAVNQACWLGPEITTFPTIPATPQKSGASFKDKEPATSAPAPSSSLAASLAADAPPSAEVEAAKGKNLTLETAPPAAHPAAHPAPAPSLAPALESTGDFHQLTLGPRLYRIGGLEKNTAPEILKITLRLSHQGLMHVDSLDLYRDSERRRFIERAAEETLLEKELLKRDLGKLLLLLEQAQQDRLATTLEAADPASVPLSPEEHAEAMDFLRTPDLLAAITERYDRAGIVGEQTNLLAAYLACASRKLAKPLAVIIQSTSAAGKSTLMDAVLSFFPGEDQVKYSAMTGQSLYYLGEGNLKHKILAIVEEEGAEKASYALKLLQSEGELTIASTGKNPHSGRMETQEYHVEGPVAIVFTTTSIDIDEELMNRCLVLTVDESTAQTERIHHLQREARTVEGILAAEARRDILRVMQNAQRLIVPMKIANPFARHLTFTSGRTRTRRDHEKYLTLIDTIALLHQHQRQPVIHQVKSGAGRASRSVEMLPVTLEDIESANRIAPEVLGRSLDELPPQTRRLLEHIKSHVRDTARAACLEPKHCHFSRRQLREKTGWSETQTRLHLERLETMEYIHRRSGKQGSLCQYQLLTDPDEAPGTWQVGLIDVEKLRQKTR
jgi:DNA primase catalytic core